MYKNTSRLYTKNTVKHRFNINGFYPARVRKSLALKTLVSAAD